MTDSLLPNEPLQSQLSAFVDDELPAAETDLFVRRLVKDAELKQTLGRYQLIGEAIRSPAARTYLSRDFSTRVAAALAQQDTMAKPFQQVPVNHTQRWLKPLAGMAIAASVALVAVLAVRHQPTSDTNNLTAGVLQPVVLTAEKSVLAKDSYVVPTDVNSPSAPLPAARLTNYVVAHSEFSSPLGRRNMMTGLLAGEQAMPVEVVQDSESAPAP